MRHTCNRGDFLLQPGRAALEMSFDDVDSVQISFDTLLLPSLFFLQLRVFNLSFILRSCKLRLSQ